MDDTPEPKARSPKAEPTPGLSEAELSRIAREAVHQAPDSRLDKQLARMGLLDASESAVTRPGQPPSHPAEIDPELERLRGELRRTRLILWAFLAVIAILGLVIIALLSR